MKNRKLRFPASSRAFALEPRVLFDGAGGAAVAEQLPESDKQNDASADAPAPLPASFSAPMLLGGPSAAPEIDSILRQTPSFDTTNAESVTFRVTFNEKVTGVTANSFVIAPGSLSGATIQLVTAVGSEGRQYDVVVGNLSGSGTLNIDLAASSGVKSQASDVALATTNPADVSRDHSYTIDRVINAPRATGIDVGQVSSTTITTSANSGFSLSGRADAGDTLRVYLGSVLVGSGTANAAGEWTVDVQPASALAEGSYNLVVRSNDAAGNTKAETYALQIDTSSPVLVTGSSKVSDIIVTLQFSEDLSAAGIPSIADFLVKADGVGVEVTQVLVQGRTVQLTLRNAVSFGQSVTLSYSGNSLSDLAGSKVANITDWQLVDGTNEVNQAPVVVPPSIHQWFSLGDSPKGVFSGAFTFADGDDSYFEKAVVRISNNRQAGDVLSVAGDLPAGIRASFNSATGTLTMTGHARIADYQTALSQLRFSATTGADAHRTIELKVNDGQSDSVASTRYMRVLERAFSLSDTTTAYLLNNSGGALQGVNLVMGTVELVLTAKLSGVGLSDANALGFSPLDGHLYASNNEDKQIIRINADGTVTVIANHGAGDSNPGSAISADIDANGIMYLHGSGSGKIYRFDTNPTSSTYGTWLTALTVSGGATKTDWVDMSVNPLDGMLYAASNNLYRIDPQTGVVVNLGAITGKTGGSFPMQYFDRKGFFYFTSGGSDPTINRLDISNPQSPGLAAIATKYLGSTLPGTGDAGRIVTIDLDFGDAPNSYKTNLADNGARHNLLGSQVWLGNSPSAEADATSSAAAALDTDDGISVFPALRVGMSSYSVDVKVTNTGSAAATLIGWVDFNKDGKFSVNEAATVTVAANTVNGTVRLTWAVPGGLNTGDTYVRLRIASEWNAAVDVSGHDQRSYGPRMDGEVEDYKITIQLPDSEPPTVTQVTVVGGDTGPRSTPVGLVQVVFSEPVVGVDISDFTLTRDGQVITLPANTPVSGSGTTWTIDLSALTSPTGRYVLSVPNGADILDDAGNQLTDGGSTSFEIDTTAPVIDLDTANDSSRDWQATSLAGAAVSLDNNDGPAQVVEQDNGRSEITRIDITIYGIRDEGHERLLFGTRALDASGDFATQSNVLVGAVAVDISYSNGTFTLVRSGGGVLTQEQASAIVADLQYRNELNSDATNGERLFSITATDRAGVKSNPVLATVEVSGGSGNSGVQIPTVDSLYTADTTPTLTGQANVPVGAALTVTVNGVTYTWQAGTASTAPLQYDPDSYQWHLTIPPADALADGIYPVTATVVNGADSRSDITSNELVVDTLPPEPPTVVSQITSDLTPTITGNADVRDGEYLEVQVNGVTYKEGDGNLLRVNNQWTLVIPPGNALTPNQTYDVTATTFDRAGNSRNDSTSAELIIDTVAPVLDLNPADTSTLNDRVITYGAAVSLDVSASPASLTEDRDRLTHISMTVSGLKDGSDEQLKLGSQTFAASGASLTSVQVEGVAFNISHSGSTFTIARSDGTAMTVSEAKAVIAALQYQNSKSSGTASSGERTFSFTVTDQAGLSSAAAVAHVVIPEPVTVSSPVVNEASPYAVFTVTGTPGEVLTLALADGSGAKGAEGSGTDFGSKTTAPNLEYSLDNGESWIEYTGSSFVLTTDDGSLLVRTPIVNDTDEEGSETFTLEVQVVGGSSATGTATIKDDASGSIFNADGSPNLKEPGVVGYVVPDDDRRVTVSSPQVNEASEHIVYTVTGTANQAVELELASSGTATAETDYQSDIEYSTDNGVTWKTYSADTPVVTPTSATILVRVPLNNDDGVDNGETVILQATPVGGHTSSGTATITDDSTGKVFKSDGSVDLTAPGAPGYVVPDDDRRVTVSSPQVNEASEHIVYTVTGTANQAVELELASSGTATAETDYKSGIEYSTDNGVTWKIYSADTPVVTPTSNKILVRVELINDAVADNGETVVLQATPVGGHSSTGTATIKDDASGSIFNVDGSPNLKAQGVVGYVVPDDDRRVTVSSPQVNEASEHIVYTVTGTANQAVELALASSGTATAETDYQSDIEYSTDNGVTWKTYSADTPVVTPTSATILVRVPLNNDDGVDNGETVILQATPVGGHTSSGTASITDDSTGKVFKSDGSVDLTAPGAPGYVVPDDDRRVTVSSSQVNEASEHIVYTVTGTANQAVELALVSSGTATAETDYKSGIEYSTDNGVTWKTYSADTPVVTPSSDKILVRVELINDAAVDNGETVVLQATPVGGHSSTGTATIKDDASGSIFNVDGSPNLKEPGAVGYVVPDDDRRVTVSSPQVNEASEHIVYTVTGTANQAVELELASSGTATAETDYQSDIEYSTDNGATWKTYSAKTPVVTPAGATFLVRVPLNNDDGFDNGETVILQATPVGGHTSSGTATITDDSTGTIFKSDGSVDLATPGAPGYVVPDDDRRVTVSSPQVNEASPHIVYSVTGTAGQAVQLAIVGGTATDGGVDYHSTLQYSTDNGSTWQAYSAVVLTPASGGFLVRVPLVNDSVADNGETVLLQATPIGGHNATGTATIYDDGTGSIFKTDGSVAPGTRGEPGYVQKDDDRRVTVTSPQVNEASPHAVYTVIGTPGQALEIEITGGTASAGSDYQPVIEYSSDNGQTWRTYAPGTPVVTPASGDVLIRVPLINDTFPDNNETLVVTVTPLGGHPAQGTATLTDDGSGTVFGPDGKPRTDVVLGDDHKPSAGPVLSSESPDGRPVTVDVVRTATDPNGDPLRVTEINGQPVRPGQIIVVEQGTIRLDDDGRITFTPKSGTQGDLTINYTLSDPSGRSATGAWNISVQVAPVIQPTDSGWGRTQEGFSYWRESSAVGVRPAQALLLDGQARESSVFFDGSVFDRITRLHIPLHPTLFINNEVARTQSERESDDQRVQMAGAFMSPTEQRRGPQSIDPGFVAGQYVRGEVFNTQQLAKRLADIAAGRFAPLLIQSEPIEEQADEVDEPAASDAPAQTEASRNSGNAPVGAARSFTEQLRQGGQRLPLAVR